MLLPADATNNSIAAAYDISDSFSLASDPDIFDSTTVLHTTVNATGNGKGGYYKVNLAAGTVITIDIDGIADPNVHDSWLRLLDSDGNIEIKAGGATVQETLAACTPMIITQVVPGQEEGNARLILESGAGALATSPTAIAEAVRDAVAGGGRSWSAWHRAAISLSRPGASEDIARSLLANGAG